MKKHFLSLTGSLLVLSLSGLAQSAAPSSAPPDSGSPSSKSAAKSKPANSAPKTGSTAKPPALKQVPERVSTMTPITIPSNAVKGEDGNFHATDAQGMKWMYKETPFGISKTEDKPPMPVQAVSTLEKTTTATELGDTVHFEKRTPFGVTRWEKKKTDLTADEQSVLDEQAKSAKKTQ